MRGKLAVFGVAVTATLSGCSALTGSGTTATAATGPTPGVHSTPSPMRVIAVAAPKAKSGAPALATTGANWMSIMKSLTGYGQWLLANPDPALVGNVAVPGCGQATRLTQQVDGLLDSNTYVQAVPPALTQVVGLATATGSSANLTVVASRAAEPVLSSKKAGRTVNTVAPYGVTTFAVTLSKGADSRWRLCDVTTPSAAPATLL